MDRPSSQNEIDFFFERGARPSRPLPSAGRRCILVIAAPADVPERWGPTVPIPLTVIFDRTGLVVQAWRGALDDYLAEEVLSEIDSRVRRRGGEAGRQDESGGPV